MSKLKALSLKKLQMDYPFMTGIRKNRDTHIFPSSPTIVNILQIDEVEKQKYLVSRNRLLAQKYQDHVVHDSRLRPYQNADVNFLLHLNKGKGVFNQQRLGKTPTTLVTMRLKNQNNNLIIVPKSTIYQWKKEFLKWHRGSLIEIKDSWNKSKRAKAYKENKGTLIINYEKARIDFEELRKHLAPFDAIILDEAHVLRNYTGLSENAKSPRTVKAIIKLRKESTDAYALSGTPTPNKESNIIGILAFLYPDLFEYYWNTVDYYFSKTLETAYGNKDFFVVDGFINDYKKQEMLEFLETFSIQRKRKDVIKWLPKVDYEIIRLDPDPKQLQYHKELSEYFETEHVVCENPLTTMIALRQITHYSKILKLEAPSPKFEWIKEHLTDYPEKAVVIVSAFSSILIELQKYLDKVDTRLMYGQTNAATRQQYIEDFQTSKYNVLLANIQVAKEGITLSRAEKIIFLDPSLTYTDNLQMSDRFLPTTPEEAINKEGQKIIHLVVRKTIDVYIQRALKLKKQKTDIINNYLKYLS